LWPHLENSIQTKRLFLTGSGSRFGSISSPDSLLQKSRLMHYTPDIDSHTRETIESEILMDSAYVLI
jgi:hypothetical protein